MIKENSHSTSNQKLLLPSRYQREKAQEFKNVVVESFLIKNLQRHSVNTTVVRKRREK